MSQEEVIEIRDRIKSLIDNKKIDEEVDSVLADLDTLKNFPFNKGIITSTKIASVVSQCKSKPKNANIKRSAAELFEILRDVLNSKAEAKPKAILSEVNEGTRKEAREKISKRIQDKIKKNNIKPSVDVNKIVIELEEAFYRESRYSNKVSDFLKVLSAENKSELRIAERLLSGELKPDQVAKFTNEDYLTSSEREKNMQYREEAFNESVVYKPPPVQSELFECRKCGSKNVSYYQLQTRSADEPMTNFCTCQSCGARWKE